MFKNLTYKQQLRGLALLALLIIILCYRMAFSATIDQYNLYQSHLRNTIPGETSSQTAANINKRSNALASRLNNYVLDTLDNAKNFLSVVSSYCDKNKLELKEYKPIGQKPYDSIQVLTRSITVEGSFIECLKLNYQLEKQNNCGRIGSVLYKSYTNTKDKSTYLNCTIYLLNIIDYDRKK